MPLPPRRVPDNLTAEDYSALAVLYGLIEDHQNALEAGKRASILKGAAEGLTHPSTQDEAPFEQGAKLGQMFLGGLMKMLSSGGSEGKEETSDTLAKLIEEAKKGGATDEQIDSMNQLMQTLMGQLEMEAEPPPRDVPTSGLTAEEYYDLGVKYKACGWTEQARDALRYAMEQDPEGETGQNALRFLRSKIPRHAVPLFAEQSNIQGFNQMMSQDLEGAKETFKTLIKDYPDFEWPQGNLGSIYIREGDLSKAEEILINAVQINPYYINAWYHLTRANILQSKFQQARYCLDRVREIDPNEDSIGRYEAMLNEIQHWEENGGLRPFD